MGLIFRIGVRGCQRVVGELCCPLESCFSKLRAIAGYITGWITSPASNSYTIQMLCWRTREWYRTVCDRYLHTADNFLQRMVCHQAGGIPLHAYSIDIGFSHGIGIRWRLADVIEHRLFPPGRPHGSCQPVLYSVTFSFGPLWCGSLFISAAMRSDRRYEERLVYGFTCRTS